MSNRTYDINHFRSNNIGNLINNEIEKRNQKLESEIVDTFINLPDEFILTDGNAILKCFRMLNQQIRFNVQEFFDYMMYFNTLLNSFSFQYFYYKENIYRTIYEAPYDKMFEFSKNSGEVETLKEISVDIFITIINTIINEKLYIEINGQPIMCYRIRNWDQFSITLIKYNPWV